jgi:hypothetical protein
MAKNDGLEQRLNDLASTAQLGAFSGQMCIELLVRLKIITASDAAGLFAEMAKRAGEIGGPHNLALASTAVFRRARLTP